MAEFREKQKRIRALLEKHKLDALLLSRVGSFAWATCGAASCVSILVTEQGYEILTTMTDWPRIPIHINGQTICRPAIFERT